MIFDVDATLWLVMKTRHVAPGKGVACMQVEMCNIETDSKTSKRFNSAERAEQATLNSRNMQHLHEDSGADHCMDMVSHEQLELNASWQPVGLGGSGRAGGETRPGPVHTKFDGGDSAIFSILQGMASLACLLHASER